MIILRSLIHPENVFLLVRRGCSQPEVRGG